MGGTLRLADRQVDTRLRTVKVDDGTVHRLSPLEAQLLAYLASHPGRPVDQDELLGEVWGYRKGVTTRTVFNTVRRLRTKIERDPSSPAHLVTVRGAGYAFIGDPVGAAQGPLALGDVDAETLPAPSLGSAAGGVVLVLAGCRAEPDRVGECVELAAGETRELGRGVGARSAGLKRRRPGREVPTGPLGSPHLSRRQIRLTGAADHVRVENLGRCPLVHAGREVSSARVGPGGSFALGDEALFVVARRAAFPTRAPPPPRFGEADDHGLVGESAGLWEVRAAIARLRELTGDVWVHGPALPDERKRVALALAPGAALQTADAAGWHVAARDALADGPCVVLLRVPLTGADHAWATSRTTGHRLVLASARAPRADRGSFGLEVALPPAPDRLPDVPLWLAWTAAARGHTGGLGLGLVRASLAAARTDGLSAVGPVLAAALARSAPDQPLEA